MTEPEHQRLVVDPFQASLAATGRPRVSAGAKAARAARRCRSARSVRLRHGEVIVASR